jgi:hypothetical protein
VFGHVLLHRGRNGGIIGKGGTGAARRLEL